MHVQNLTNRLWDIRIFLGLVPKESPCTITWSLKGWLLKSALSFEAKFRPSLGVILNVYLRVPWQYPTAGQHIYILNVSKLWILQITSFSVLICVLSAYWFTLNNVSLRNTVLPPQIRTGVSGGSVLCISNHVIILRQNRR